MAWEDLRVLVVDSQGFQRRLTLELLGHLGVRELLEAADAEAALDGLHAGVPAPDVVILDLDDGRYGDDEFIARLAECPRVCAVVPVSAGDDGRLRAVEELARDHGLRVPGRIRKPITAARLATALAAYEDGADLGPDAVAAAPDEVRAAFERGEFAPCFQPQADVASGAVVLVEALARWCRADGRQVGPPRFLPLIERAGLGERFSWAMLDRSCHWLHRWRQAGWRLGLSVNVSALGLAQPEVAERFERIARGHGIDPGEITLEIEERDLVREGSRIVPALTGLRLKGFGLAIDDFAIGDSALAQRLHVPFSALKIDQGLLETLRAQPARRAVAESNLELARGLGMAVVVKGVETTDDWRDLAALGCTRGQGFLIARPSAGEALPAAIADWQRRHATLRAGHAPAEA